MSIEDENIVAGRKLETSLGDHVRRCEALILEEQERVNPDNALIAALCDSVRLAREHIDVRLGRTDPLWQARPLDEWHEETGSVLWWTFPVNEPPYVGSPLSTNWPGYHTHWTSIALPRRP